MTSAQTHAHAHGQIATADGQLETDPVCGMRIAVTDNSPIAENDLKTSTSKRKGTKAPTMPTLCILPRATPLPTPRPSRQSRWAFFTPFSVCCYRQ